MSKKDESTRRPLTLKAKGAAEPGEAHCPTDALYVAAERRPAPTPSEAELAERQLLGSYRARLGWGKGRRPPRSFDEALALAQRPEAAAGVSPAGAQPGAQPRKEAHHG